MIFNEGNQKQFNSTTIRGGATIRGNTVFPFLGVNSVATCVLNEVSAPFDLQGN